MNQTAPDFFKQNENANTITLNPKSYGLNFNQTEDHGFGLKKILASPTHRNVITESDLGKGDFTQRSSASKATPDPNRLYKQETMSSQLKRNPKWAYE
jgi:hypothetical protein